MPHLSPKSSDCCRKITSLFLTASSLPQSGLPPNHTPLGQPGEKEVAWVLLVGSAWCSCGLCWDGEALTSRTWVPKLCCLLSFHPWPAEEHQTGVHLQWAYHAIGINQCTPSVKISREESTVTFFEKYQSPSRENSSQHLTQISSAAVEPHSFGSCLQLTQRTGVLSRSLHEDPETFP